MRRVRLFLGNVLTTDRGMQPGAKISEFFNSVHRTSTSHGTSEKMPAVAAPALTPATQIPAAPASETAMQDATLPLIVQDCSLAAGPDAGSISTESGGDSEKVQGSAIPRHDIEPEGRLTANDSDRTGEVRADVTPLDSLELTTITSVVATSTSRAVSASTATPSITVRAAPLVPQGTISTAGAGSTGTHGGGRTATALSMPLPLPVEAAMQGLTRSQRLFAATTGQDSRSLVIESGEEFFLFMDLRAQYQWRTINMTSKSYVEAVKQFNTAWEQKCAQLRRTFIAKHPRAILEKLGETEQVILKRRANQHYTGVFTVLTRSHRSFTDINDASSVWERQLLEASLLCRGSRQAEARSWEGGRKRSKLRI